MTTETTEPRHAGRAREAVEYKGRIIGHGPAVGSTIGRSSGRVTVTEAVALPATSLFLKWAPYSERWVLVDTPSIETVVALLDYDNEASSAPRAPAVGEEQAVLAPVLGPRGEFEPWMIGRLIRIERRSSENDAVLGDMVAILGGYSSNESYTSWFFRYDANPEGYSVRKDRNYLEITLISG